MSTRTSDARIARFMAGLATGAVAVLIVAASASPADAQRRDDDREQSRDYAPSAPVAPMPAAANGGIFQASQGYAALYEGNRARRVGDPVTIVLVERTQATKTQGTDYDSSGGFSILPPTTGALSLFSATDATVSSNRGFNGGGTASQANQLSGEITVTIAEVYGNGTMLVRGEKRLTLNRGDEFVQISGIIRPSDVDPYNRVASTRVADARISYTGKGDLARSSRQGWLSRFFQIISPF
ncbi:flagellar basal body L-ring protein FlgH [Stakelama tenebrarum]|uniref:Flagellar L-ring protein n=1 Tax=Stakelama tenebrarum TaxID=2711215 RepID=A0A6G6Y270_9SPHN|nr:flagellar basal body L-ring protein FlgH [Sphingosinithalassobacter tenebrarum]QIG78703.1 flagellar basal body L-ring protein FlgH [Sphingosinithalassobacter tenebrarum]